MISFCVIWKLLINQQHVDVLKVNGSTSRPSVSCSSPLFLSFSVPAQQEVLRVEYPDSVCGAALSAAQLILAAPSVPYHLVSPVSPLSSDLAQHYLMKANITAIRRVRKTDNNRIAR